MDKDRQFRMLIPPFFLFAAVIWEAYLSPNGGQRLLGATTVADASTLKSVLSIIGVVGVATLPVGYAIGVLTITILRLLSLLRFFPNRSYEIPISKEAMKKIQQKLGLSHDSKKSVLCAAAAFDHVLVKPGIHMWLFRRWTSFNVCTQCATALLLSCFLGRAFQLKATCKWWATVFLLIVVFIWQAIVSWRESLDMFDLAVDVKALLRRTGKEE